MKYKIINADSIEGLELKVNADKKREPIGGMTVGKDFYYQAMWQFETVVHKVKPKSVTKEEYQANIKEWKLGFLKESEADFSKAYPIVDLPKELEKAVLWLFTNTTKRKKNFNRFFNNWCARIQEKGIQRNYDTQPPLEDL